MLDRILTVVAVGTLLFCAILLKPQAKTEAEGPEAPKCDDPATFAGLREALASAPLAAENAERQARLASLYRNCGQLEEATEEVGVLLSDYGPDSRWIVKNQDARASAVQAVADALLDLAEALASPPSGEPSPLELARAVELYNSFFELFPGGRGQWERRLEFGDLLDRSGRHDQAVTQYVVAALSGDGVSAAERAIARSRQARKSASPVGGEDGEAWAAGVPGLGLIDGCLGLDAGTGRTGGTIDASVHWGLKGDTWRWLGGWPLGAPTGESWTEEQVAALRSCVAPRLSSEVSLLIAGPRSVVQRRLGQLDPLLGGAASGWDGSPGE